MAVHHLSEYRKAPIYRPMFIMALELLVDIFEAKTCQPANDAREVIALAKRKGVTSV